MSLFDFLRDRQTPQAGGAFKGEIGFSPDVAGSYENLRTLADPGELQRAPVLREEPGLLSQAWDYAKSREGRQNIGAAMQSLGGEEGAFDDLRQLRQQETAQAREAKATADRAKKNAAFKSAYQGGKFDPSAYLEALEGTDIDATDALDFQKALAPNVGVDDGVPYTQDPMSGETEWGEQRPMSYAEKLAQQRAEELEEYRRAQLGLSERRVNQGDARIGITRQREGRMAAGRGGQRAHSYGQDDVDW